MNHPKRRDTIRQLSHPHRLRESISISGPFLHRNSLISGLQVAATTVISLPLVLHSPRPDLIGFASLGALISLFGRFAPKGGRWPILLGCLMCLVFVVGGLSLATLAGAPMPLRLALLAPLTAIVSLITTKWRFGPPGALIFLFAAAATLGDVSSLTVVLERLGVMVAVSLLALLICQLTERFREASAPLPPALPMRVQVFLASRMGICAGVTALLAWEIGLSHPAWAAMGTVAVMQSTQLHLTLARVLQRVGGNMVGAAIAWVVLMFDPSPAVVIALLVLCMVLTELLIGANYGLGQMMVTPMALLMTYLALQGAAGAEIAPERVLDTLFGCLLGLAMAVLFSTVNERRLLALHHKGRKPARR